jgi:hypothetical protein
MRLSELQESQTVIEDANPVQKAAVHFFNSKVGDVDKEAVDNYVDTANSLYKKAQQQGLGDEVKQALVKAKKSPYLQGGVVTTIGAVLTGGLLASAQRFGLTPGQTNMLLQAVLNTVIPTVVSRINGRSWDETIKYTLASAATGIGAAAAMGEAKEDVVEAKMSAAVRFQRAMDRERAKTDAHYRAGEEVMARARAEQDKKKEQEKK